MSDFSAVDPGASPILSMDFIDRLAPGDSIQSATWTVEDSTGTAYPAMLSGGVTISGTAVRQKVTGWVVGTRYLHRCAVTTVNGIVIYGDMYQTSQKGA